MELVTVYLTYSRASLLVALPGTVIVATALCFKKKTGRIAVYNILLYDRGKYDRRRRYSSPREIFNSASAFVLAAVYH